MARGNGRLGGAWHPSQRAWIAGAAALATLGALVPSTAWLRLFRGSSPTFPEALLQGATLFRLGLLGLAAYVLLASRLGWFHSRPGTAGSLPRAEPTPAAWPLLVILAVAAALRLYRLDGDLWIDEILTLTQHGRAPLGEILTTYESQNQHFLYSLLARISLLAFGESAWALRLPAVAFGVASIWALYRFGREVTDRADALLAAALLAVSYHHVWFSQNARGYTALLFFVLLSSLFFLRASRASSPRGWLAYGVAAALGVYAHQTMVFTILAHLLLYLPGLISSRSPLRERLLPLLTGFVPGGLLVFLLHAIALPQILGPALADLSEVPTWKSPWWTVRETLRGLNVGLGGIVGVAAAGAVCVAGCRAFLERRPAVLTLLFAPSLLGGALMLALGHPIWPRFFLFALGFAALVLVRGIRSSGHAVGRLLGLAPAAADRLGVALAGLLVLAYLPAVAPVYRPKQDFTGAREFVNRHRQPGDVVAAVGVAAFAYKQLYAPEWESIDSAATLERLRGESRHTWIVYTLPLHLRAYHADVSRLIEAEFRLVKEFPGTLGGGSVFVYRSDGAPATPDRPAPRPGPSAIGPPPGGQDRRPPPSGLAARAGGDGIRPPWSPAIARAW